MNWLAVGTVPNTRAEIAFPGLLAALGQTACPTPTLGVKAQP